MTITLHHALIPAADKDSAARAFAATLGLEVGAAGPGGKFAQVRVNETLSLDFATVERVTPQHLAFDVDTATFDRVVGHLRAAGIHYGDDPRHPDNGGVDHALAARGLYWASEDGHLFEVMTDA